MLLVADVGFSSRAFDLRDEGLARYLAGRGVETFSFDWRGTGISETPVSFGLADLAERDLPAVVDASEARRVVLVGWGVGGSLALAYAAHDQERVVAVVALSAPLDFDVPNAVVKRWIADLPDSGLVTLPGAGDGEAGAPLFNLLYAHGNALSTSRVDEIRRRTTGRLSARVAHDLARWMQTGEAAFYGKPLRGLCAGYDDPVLLFVAPLDNWTHPEFTEAWRDVLRRITVQPMGWIDGYAEDYGHLGALFAKDARRKVFPRILDFVFASGSSK